MYAPSTQLDSLTAVCYACLYSGPAAQAKCPQCGFLLIANGLAGDRTSPNILALVGRDEGHLPGLHARAIATPLTPPSALAQGTIEPEQETVPSDTHRTLEAPVGSAHSRVLGADTAARAQSADWRPAGGTTAVRHAPAVGFGQVALVAMFAACAGVLAAAMSGMW